MTGVWLRPQRPSRSGPPLHRDRIVTAAVELLDREGVGGLTMRRLAEHLDAGPTTLYWHVATKDDVVDLALDHIFGEVRLPDGSAGDAGSDRDWRVDVEGLLLDWRAAMLRHPWSAALLGRPMLGPNVLTRTEFLQAALQRSGLVEPDLGAATHALANYVIGSAVTLSSWQRLDAPEPREAARDHLATQRDRYPTLVDTGHLDDRDWEDTFRRGLTYLLDGLPTRT
ncbi:TetR/AcrR family transcriptional regulator C-terminal domain-containing protein [Plantactinospora sp. S1510]|uniref:TetR/AcrR family transcriptional regulator C-terminal domain-containing protein n=1 Tax=Plantactinospora alkalitolerans TaxID=2789879 RepID=A0ABS0H376_9ACTN|nr:TetR/AcrR family transcriptional regulator [Plantactinospora alkalitolerans]MBF9132921.1 TetR/AcrR family transcriptional regulator C-terminal domain-containing protein [Plantactinospora alkalitolerans]